MSRLEACRFRIPTFSVLFFRLLIILCQVHSCLGQFPESTSDGNFTIVKSPVDGNITIRFKTPPKGTCATVFETQRQFTGYINIPPSTTGVGLTNYSTNTFFWFIEARQLPEKAPLTIFINGGPGSSSMVGLFQEVGPCQVVEIGRNQLGTIPRDWGWDRSSNILFIDQPVQVGFSYDQPTNQSFNLLNELFVSPPTDVPSSQPSYTFLNGTFSSGNPNFTANTSQIAAKSLWHFTQAFLGTFPQYNPYLRNASSGGINLFTESYGGKYGPAIARYFRQQNSLRKTDPVFANSTLSVTINTLGIMNGWIDLLVQTPFYPRFAYNNSYGIQAISQVQEINALTSYSQASGCQQQTLACRAQEDILDPAGDGSNSYINNACARAQAICQDNVISPYTTSGRSVYDISQTRLDPFPSSLYLEYLNMKEVQQAIGVSINYTQASPAVTTAFNNTGDYARGDILEDIVDTLKAGTRVALIYGDRDYICNWLGGEAVSFAIAQAAGVSYQKWYQAGYAPIVTNESFIGGVVREFGNLSFSRIYDAGHLVPAYQPETTFTVFSRLIQGTGISLGRKIDLASYISSGEANSTHKNQAPAAASPVCNIRAVNSTCSTDQKNILANHDGVIINGVVYSREADWQAPPASIISSAVFPGQQSQGMSTTTPRPSSVTSSASSSTSATVASSSSIKSIPTGVFTATGVPNITSTSTTSTNAAGTAMAKSNIFMNSDTQSALVLAFGIWGLGLS